MGFGLRRKSQRTNRYRSSFLLQAESLESRIVLDASGIAGNACAPDLDFSGIGSQSIAANETIEIDLYAVGALVSDQNEDGSPSGDTIRLQLDPDDNPAGATLTPEGVFRWTPTADQMGTAEFIVIAIDSGAPALADAEVFTIEVGEPPENQQPDLAAISDVSGSVDEEVVVNLSATDPDGDTLTFTLDPDQNPAAATIEQTDNNNAVLRFTPTTELAGQTVEFSVIVTDDGAVPASDTETFELTIGAVVAEDDSYVAPANGVLSIETAGGVLANDSEANDGSLTASLNVVPSNGTVTLSEDGSFSYTPDAEFSGVDSFTYFAQGAGGTSEATVTITVNAAPVAVDDAFSINEDEATSIIAAEGLLANDTDAEGDNLRVSLVEGTTSGTLSVSDDGAITFEPEPNFTGELEFTYMVSDGISDSNVATVRLIVIEVADLPVAGDDSYSVDEDAVLTANAAEGLLANDQDGDGDSLTASTLTSPANGTVTIEADGSFTYIPNADFNGTDTFTYNLSDGDNQAEGSVTITVNAVNDAPVGVDDTYSAATGTVISADAASGVLANDSDVDGDALTVDLVADVTSGTLTLNEDGSFEYTADLTANPSGSETFTYALSDGDLQDSLTTVSLQVTPQVDNNQAPVGQLDSYAAVEDETLVVSAENGVLSNDSDPDGDPITAVLLDAPIQGSITFNADGSFEYTPNQSSSGLDGFSYEVTDGSLTSSEVIVALTISTTNDEPVAADDSYTVEKGGNLTIVDVSGVLANDSDPDGDALTAEVVDEPQNGTLNLQSNGAFTYSPNADFSGVDTFTYNANDGTTISTATVSITVNDPNAFAVASNAAAAASVGTVSTTETFDSTAVYQFDSNVDDQLMIQPVDHVSGAQTASVVLVEYLDFECPACRAYHPIVSDLEETFDGDLLVVRRHLPLEDIHPNARAAARAAEAAGAQGMFEEMGDLLFDRQNDWNSLNDPVPTFESYATELGLNLTEYRSVVSDPATDARISSDFSNAVQLGASGTPSFFLQGERIDNPANLADFESVIQAEVDALDEAFAINYKTGEIVVANESALAALGTNAETKTVQVSDASGASEAIDVLITPTETGSGEASSLAVAVDQAMADDEANWEV